jgi:hypothetical protein
MKLNKILFLALLMSSHPASANGYLGFSYGSTDVEADLTSVGGGNIDSSTTLTKYYGGYRFIKYIALEAAYFNLAELSTDSLGTSPGMASGAVDMRAIGIYGVGFLPLTQSIQVYAKAGAANWDASLRRDDMTESVSDTDALYGAGISYHFKKTFGVTLDWEVIDSPNPEFSTFSIGFKWEFL